MDFEKEYKRKALEPIVNYIESVMASYSKEELEARIKKALPEKESEDERIRKEIVGYLNNRVATAEETELLYFKRWIAYLEKQKEQKPAEWSEEDLNMIGSIRSTIELDIQRDGKFPEIKETHEKELKWFDDLYQRNISVKKQEWSEEDEAAFGDLMWCIEQARKSAKDENDMGNIWFAENWVKNRIKSLRPQPKQEWSEDDEHYLLVCKNALAKYCRSEYWSYPIVSKWLEEHCNVPSQPHWKPSEEQMSCLWQASRYYKSGKIKITGNTLESLYNDLKKL